MVRLANLSTKTGSSEYANNKEICKFDPSTQNLRFVQRNSHI